MKPLVLDLTRLLPGPLAARILAEQGFPVLRLVPPQGDLLGSVAPQTHAWINQKKQEEVVDLKSARGRERLMTLAREASVLLETNRPGVMERLQVGPGVLRGVNPGLVYVRIAGSPDPDYRESPGHDLTYLAADGLLGRFEAVWRHLPLADVCGAFWAALAALDGLRMGGGFYEVYLEQAARLLAYPPVGFEDGSRICYGIYPAREGEIALAALEPQLWERFCLELGRREWLEAAFSTARPENPVYCGLLGLLGSRSADEWEAWARERILPLRRVRRDRSPDPVLPWRRAD